MPKSFAKGGSGSSGITVGTTTSTGTAETLLKTNATGKVADATGVAQASGKTIVLTSQAATDEPLTVKGAAAQSGNLVEFTNNSDVLQAYVSSTGQFHPKQGVNYNSIILGTDATPTTGIGANATFVTLVRSGVAEFSVTDNAVSMRQASHLTWNSSTTGAFDAAQDTGLARYSAGVVKSTNGTTGISGLMGGGAAVASAAALPLPTGRVFHVTGTTSITSITSTNFASGAVITLIFDGILTFTDGGNLKLAGNFVTTADDTITLVYDGTNWYETCRSVN